MSADIALVDGDELLEARVERADEEHWSVRLAGEEIHGVSWVPVAPGLFSLTLGGRSYEVFVERQGAEVRVELVGAPALEQGDRDRAGLMRVFDFAVYDRNALPPRSTRSGRAGRGADRVTAPMPGKVVALLAAPGEVVEAGQGLLVVEAMKMENELKAPAAARVAQVAVRVGETVEQGALLVRLEPVEAEGS